MIINLEHKSMNEKERYENVKELYRKYPDMIMKPKKWKKLRKLELNT